MLDRNAATRAGVKGLLLRVSSDEARAASVNIDYRAVRHRYGGDWASRLQVVRVHDGKVFPGHNDLKNGKLRVELPVPARKPLPSGLRADNDPSLAEGALFAVTAASSGPNGSLQPTTLAPSLTWQVGLNSGDFGWSYPMSVPDLPGLSPDVGLTYSSGSVDGRIAATNNQPSIVGEGFDSQAGFIERSYQSCKDDGHTTSQELCFASQNATVALPGMNGSLVRDDATGVWRSEEDSGWRVEFLTGATNGDNDGEHWRLTSPDGTQYYFGRSAAAKSTWTVPVFGDDAGEPCHQATFGNAWCVQAYRWNLDYVVDTHGDAMAYYYDIETNYYSRAQYVRAGQLNRIEYGFRDGSAAPAAGRVLFTTAPRCIPGTVCDPASHPQNFPDVPLDQQCTSTTCDIAAPTFWTTRRLAEIRTQVHHNSAYRDVASWTLNHQFPSNGDGTDPGLWLESIVHTGHVGATVSVPAVRFDGELLDNRVDGLDMQRPFAKWRLKAVTNETGGRIEATYARQECSRSSLPTPDGNTKSCFPGYWMMGGSTEPTLDWFHKNRVTRIVERDMTGSGNAAEVTEYEYLGGAGWTYDTGELLPARFKSWGQFRGYQRTRVKYGDPLAGPQRVEEHLFLRGMDDDLLSDGSRRDVWVGDSQGGTIEDKPVRRGFTREMTVFNGAEWLSRTISEPVEIRRTASRNRPVGPLEAYLTEERSEREYTRHEGGVWVTETVYSYDDHGRVVETNDRGDLSTPADDTCARTSYTQNLASWIVDTLARIETVGVGCDVAPTGADLIADQRHYYDGATSITATPVKGDLTRAEEVAEPGRYVSMGSARYDTHGRLVESTDPSGDRNTVVYTPETGGPVTTVATTDALGHTNTTSVDPLLGTALSVVDANGVRTDMTYDALGRTTAGWAPGRNKAAGQSPSATFAYLVRGDAPSAVTSRSLLSNGSYQVSHELFDGFLRTRQTQSPSPVGGRIITDTFHDSHGRIHKTTDDYWNGDAAPATTLFKVPDAAVTAQTRMIFDPAGRVTDEILLSYGAEKWRTRTLYGPNWTAVDPPAGGTPTMEVFDLEGRTVELRQFHGQSPTGTYDATKYTYNTGGQRTSVTDAAGNVWRSHYDLRGRVIRDEDPDTGATTYTYDDEDQQLSSTDSRGITLTSTYDALGRKTGHFKGQTKLAEWTYDTLPNGKGLPVASKRYVDGNVYSSEVTGYQQGTGLSSGSKVTIPASEGSLAGTYLTSLTYDAFGRIITTGLPSAPGLPNETLTQRYDEFDQPKAMSGLDRYVDDTWYDEFGRVVGTAHGAPGRQVWSGIGFDPVTGRLETAATDREVEDSPGVSAVTYTYDAVGNVLSSSDAVSGDHQCFGYDYLTRLTEAWTPASGKCGDTRSATALGGPAPYWHSFGYDKTGNRLSEVRHAAGGDTTRAYSYPSAGSAQPHTLKSVTTTGPGESKTDTYTHDKAGNMLTRQGQDLNWDAEGQLQSIGDTSFLYDADGNRLIRRDPSGTTLYLGGLEIHRSTAGTTTSTRYYGNFAVRTSAGLNWLVSDHQGTANITIRASDLAVTRRYQTPFGQSRGATVSWPSERSFVGGTKDPSTGLVHLGAREYDPDIGRFISIDPIIDDADPQQMNGYAYANNSPVTFSDPDGLKYKCSNPRQCDGSDAKQRADAAKRKAAAARAAQERARQERIRARNQAAAARAAAKQARQDAARQRAEERRKERIRAKNQAAAAKAAAKAARDKAKKERAAQRKRDAALAKCGGSVRACQKKDEERYTKKVCHNKASCEHYERRFVRPADKKPVAQKCGGRYGCTSMGPAKKPLKQAAGSSCRGFALDCWKADNDKVIRNVSKGAVMVGGAAAGAVACGTVVLCAAGIGAVAGALSYAITADEQEWDNGDFMTEVLGGAFGGVAGNRLAPKPPAKPRIRGNWENGELKGYLVD
ncbi:RHS repeat-associated core domain-containing protein [Micromonospora sp. NPDC047670]|uniref:RHS repeat-associated core domain-containing protein n=1 Tax=Micromonospora sp. NPDC047670 TaxID=3364252 RepID=UPI00372429BA